MSNEVRGQAEGFPTLITLVAFRVTMDSLVVCEEKGLAEGFSTFLALTGFLLTVNSLVSIKVGAASKVFFHNVYRDKVSHQYES